MYTVALWREGNLLRTYDAPDYDAIESWNQMPVGMLDAADTGGVQVHIDGVGTKTRKVADGDVWYDLEV